MIQRSSNIALIISIIISSVLIASLFFMYGRLEKIYGDIIGLREEIVGLNNQGRDLKLFETFISNTQEEREKISYGFINSDNLVKYVEDVERVGKDSGVDASVLSANQAKNIKDLGPAFHIQASGSFLQVFKYSFLLESMAYEIAFEKIELNKSDDGKWKGDYIVRLLSYEF